MYNSQGLEKVLSLRQEILAGDEKRLKEQRDAGKLTARERIAKIADAGSFVELFALVSRNDEGAGVVTGYATIEERPVYLFAQDFTVRGGAMGQLQAAKIVKLLELAQKTGAPVLALMDSAGVRIDEGARTLTFISLPPSVSVELSDGERHALPHGGAGAGPLHRRRCAAVSAGGCIHRGGKGRPADGLRPAGHGRYER